MKLSHSLLYLLFEIKSHAILSIAKSKTQCTQVKQQSNALGNDRINKNRKKTSNGKQNSQQTENANHEIEMLMIIWEKPTISAFFLIIYQRFPMARIIEFYSEKNWGDSLLLFSTLQLTFALWFCFLFNSCFRALFCF